MSTSGGADALLKGMLGIGISDNNRGTQIKTIAKSEGGKIEPSTNKKKNAATPGTNTPRGKPRAGSQGRRRSSQGTGGGESSADGGGDDAAVKKYDKGKGKKKKNASKKGKDTGKAVYTPSAKEKLLNTKNFSSSTHNAANYAWSAFQSSPDPSALPDIGGLFGDDGGGFGIKGTGNEDEATVDDAMGGGAVGESSLNLGSPSVHIRKSLIHSVTDQELNAGEALLQRLTSQKGPALESIENDDKVDKTFRTMESLEAEMLSPQQKKKTEIDEAATVENEAPSADIGGKGVTPEVSADAGVSNRAAKTQHQPKQSAQFEYPEANPIMELMNPGGHPGGYGMPMQQQQYQQHQPFHHHPQMPHHQPQHYGGHPMHSYPGGHQNMPHPQMQMHHQYHHQYHHQPPPPPPNGVPPGYTTIQVRVPHELGPGNTMLVHGMSIPVPSGVPPGAVIPVMIPIQGPAGNHHNPSHPYGQNYYQHQQMGGYNNNPNPQEQKPEPNSWAAKVAAGSPMKKETKVKAAPPSKEMSAKKIDSSLL